MVCDIIHAHSNIAEAKAVLIWGLALHPRDTRVLSSDPAQACSRKRVRLNLSGKSCQVAGCGYEAHCRWLGACTASGTTNRDVCKLPAGPIWTACCSLWAMLGWTQRGAASAPACLQWSVVRGERPASVLLPECLVAVSGQLLRRCNDASHVLDNP